LQGRGSSPEAAAGAAIYAARTVKDATVKFEQLYERHAGPPQPARMLQAQAIYDKYAAEGGIFTGAQRVVVGERGPETVLPLNAQGLDFLAALMKRITPGDDARSVGLHGRSTPMISNTHNYYQIDKSNKFTGPIHVTAASPTSFIQQLREQQRHSALGQPLLTSVA
jgi:hypothetical protein